MHTINKSNNRKILIISLIFIIVLTLIAFTFSAKMNNLTSNIFTDVILIDEEAYGENEFNSSNLDFRPILDKNVGTSLDNIIYINFNVGGSKKNNRDNIVYDIALVDLKIDCDLVSPYLKWKLIKNGEEVFEGSFDYKFDTISNGRLILTTIQQDLKKFSEDKSLYDHYEFYLWLSDSCQSDNLFNCQDSVDQNYLLGKSISGKIEVELYGATKKELVRKPSNSLDISTCIKRDGENDGTNE